MIEDKIIFEQLIESLQEGVVFIDEKNNLTYFNNSALKFLPPDMKKLIGKNILSCHMPEKIETVLKIIENFKRGQRKHYYQHTRRMGSKYYEDRIYPVHNPKGIYIGLLILVQDVTRRKKLEKEIRALAIKDGLTGLYNLRHFYQELKRELARSRRQQGYNTSLLFFDIDNFKQYNDLFGHKKGDKVLKNVAETAAQVTRNNVDSVFRYGGDEFAVILPDTAQEVALLVAERLRATYVAKQIHNSSLSIGVISYKAGVDIDTLIEQADQAMYAAKFAGGNRVQLYQPGLSLPNQTDPPSLTRKTRKKTNPNPRKS